MKTETDGSVIERRVRETMEAFDRPDALPPDPHFYGRVMARLAENRRPRGAFAGVLKPALLTALVVLNLATAVSYLGARGRQASLRQRTAFAQTLADDLNLAGEPRPFLEEEQD